MSEIFAVDEHVVQQTRYGGRDCDLFERASLKGVFAYRFEPVIQRRPRQLRAPGERVTLYLSYAAWQANLFQLALPEAGRAYLAHPAAVLEYHALKHLAVRLRLHFNVCQLSTDGEAHLLVETLGNGVCDVFLFTLFDYYSPVTHGVIIVT